MEFVGNLDAALDIFLDEPPGRVLLLTPNRGVALQVHEHLIRHRGRRGIVGDAIRPWGDYVSECFRRIAPDKRPLPLDVSTRCVEQAATYDDTSLQILGPILQEPGAAEEVAETLESLLAAGRHFLLGLGRSARNRDLARLATFWLKLVDHAGLVSRNEIPHLVQQAFQDKTLTESRHILLLSHSPVLPDAPLVETLRQHAPVRLFQLSAAPQSPPDSNTLLARFQAEPVRPAAAQFEGATPDGTLRILACPGEEDESRRVLETIRRGIRDGRWKPDDCAIVVRDAGAYLEHLRQGGESFQVPLAMRQHLPVEQLPLTRLLLAPLQLIQGGFQRETVAAFIRHPVVEPWFRKSCDEWDPGRLTHILREHGIGGPGEENPDDWILHLNRVLEEIDHDKQRLVNSEADDHEREGIKERLDRQLTFLQQHRDGLQALFNLIQALPPEGKPENFRAAFEKLYETLEIGPTLARLGADGFRQQPRWVERDFIAFYQVRRALESLVARSGWLDEPDPKLTAGEVLERLRLILEERPIPIHHKRDGAVEVVRPEELRPGGYRAVFVMGLLHGSYPRFRSTPALVDEAMLDQTPHAPARQRRAEEDLLAHVFRSARECLTLSYPHTGEDGRARLYAGVIEHLRQAFAQAGLVDAHGELDREIPFSLRLRPPGDCYDAEGLLETLCARLRQGADAESAGIYNAWREEPDRRDRFIHIARPAVMEAERGSWCKPGPYDGRLEGFADLRERFEAHVFERELSTSRVNTYATCPAQYYYRHLLGLDVIEPPEPGLTPLERGQLLHDIMNDFLERSKDLNFPLSEADAPRALERLESVARRKFQPRDFPDKSRALLQLEFEGLRRYFSVIVRREVANNDNAAYTPSWFEYSFNALPVPLPESGREVRFRGRIDRVDFAGDGTAFVVIDYKTGSSAPSYKDITEGHEFQLPIYARAVMHERDAVCDMAYYYPLLNTGKKGKEPGKNSRYVDAGEGSLWESVVRPSLESKLTSLASGWFVPQPRSNNICDRCDFQAVCRYNERRMEWKASGADGTAGEGKGAE